ncbi:uncharacterized protein LOC109841582 [Asparagus officinalis]|uniref:uncharacterized protein LOC109841582 n=1 Tax=Asparagus officinalis TaxID=4686 RepID=UPI00098E1E9C|nr:uncharacterized protein LOC109841582 [Asparagus officinalis]
MGFYTDKVKAIQELPPPRNLKELRGLQGRLAYIRRFISNLSRKCQSFSKLMKKGVSFMWDDACQKAFEEIKQYLSNPSILIAPKSDKPFLIYIRATDHVLAALLAQDDENGHEQAVYYLSWTLSGAEPRYPLIEKECLALVFTVQMMRYYLVGQTIHVISQINPIRAVKGQAICDLMANHPLKEKAELYQYIPDETYEVNIVSREQISRKKNLFVDEHLDSTMILNPRLCIENCTMGFCFAVCQIEKQNKFLKKLMMVYVEHISLTLNCGTGYADWVITGLIWYKTLSHMPNDVMPARYTIITCIDRPSIFIRQPLHGLLKRGDGHCWPSNPTLFQGTSLYLSKTDYFSKWTEAIPLREVKTSDVIKFLKHHIVYRYGVPRRIIHDNGPQFVSQAFTRFCEKFRIKNLVSTTYNPATNGHAEAFNKAIVIILTKVVSTNKRD